MSHRPEMIQIRPGSFMMGSPDGELGRDYDERLHPVEITVPFEIQVTPVTQAQYESLVGRKHSCQFAGPYRPIERLSWFDAVKFCNALSRAEGLEEAYVMAPRTVAWKGLHCRGYRLPTEAEWEYACRAGTEGPCYGQIDEIAWHRGNSGGTTHSVRAKTPNAWGLYDMLGNVWEWCWDYFNLYPEGSATDPTGPEEGAGRVYRGGCWDRDMHSCRAAERTNVDPGDYRGGQGLRLARTVDPKRSLLKRLFA